jgi:hypothetical protein
MADALDLGSSAERREGSSPFIRTTKNSKFLNDSMAFQAMLSFFCSEICNYLQQIKT